VGRCAACRQRDVCYGQRAAALASAELAFRGVGAKQDFVTGFEKRMGRKLIGTLGLVGINPAAFDEPLFAELFTDILRAEAASNIMAFNASLRESDLGDSLDDGLFTAIHDVKLGGDLFPYRTDLLELAASRILVPAGSPLSVSVFDGGIKDAAGLTVDGKPLVVTMAAPFFNHQDQIAILKDVLVDDAQNPGQKISRILRVNGTEKLSQMVIDANLVASLAPGYSASASAARLAADGKALAAILDDSATCVPGTPACYRITGPAARAAGFMLDVYADSTRVAASAAR